MITIKAPVILLIHRIVRILKLPWKRLSSHETKNQYVTDPALTARMIGVTVHVCGALSARPKNAKRANMTKIAIGFEIPSATACPKSFGETLDSPSALSLLNGFENAMDMPTAIRTAPPTSRIVH